MKGSDVVWLHALLNYHLGPPDDQLPIIGAEAGAFGPRTEEKVKRFQMLNRIDIGTPFFMDGVVGQHTWGALHPLNQVTFDLLCRPLSLATPRLTSHSPDPYVPWGVKPRWDKPNLGLPTSYSPDHPYVLPLPTRSPPHPVSMHHADIETKLHLDNFQLQSGETTSVPTKGNITEAHTLSLAAVVLGKSDGLHVENQPGVATNWSSNGPAGDTPYYKLTDFGITYAVNLANMPGSGKYFNWSIAAQLALMKSLTDRTGAAAQASVLGGRMSA